MPCNNALIIRGLLCLAAGAFVLAAIVLLRCGVLPESLVSLISGIVMGLLAAVKPAQNTPPPPPKDESHEP